MDTGMEDVVKAAEGSASVAGVARKLGCQRRLAFMLMAHHGVVLEEEQQLLLTAAQYCGSGAELARSTGVSVAVVERWLNRTGTELGGEVKRGKPSGYDEVTVRTVVPQQPNWEAAAKSLGVGRSTVIRWAHKAGVKPGGRA